MLDMSYNRSRCMEQVVVNRKQKTYEYIYIYIYIYKQLIVNTKKTQTVKKIQIIK